VNLGSKKDPKVSRVGLRWSHNTLFSLPIKVLFPKLTSKIKGKWTWNKHTWKAQYNKKLYVAFGKDELLLKNRKSINFLPIG
jgi:hypothetical protein